MDSNWRMVDPAKTAISGTSCRPGQARMTRYPRFLESNEARISLIRVERNKTFRPASEQKGQGNCVKSIEIVIRIDFSWRTRRCCEKRTGVEQGKNQLSKNGVKTRISISFRNQKG